MCYAAQVEQELKVFRNVVKAKVDITDEPAVEVSAAGHDRCIIPLKETGLKKWLSPQYSEKAELYALLDDREERPYHEHRMAA